MRSAESRQVTGQKTAGDHGALRHRPPARAPGTGRAEHDSAQFASPAVARDRETTDETDCHHGHRCIHSHAPHATGTAAVTHPLAIAAPKTG